MARATLLVVARVALVLAMVIILRQHHVAFVAGNQSRANSEAFSLETIRRVLPAAARVESKTGPAESSVISAFDKHYEPVGYAVATSPAADSVIGFAGPTRLLIGFDVEDRIQKVYILNSNDTLEHLEAVRQDPRFLDSFVGQTWSEAASPKHLDAVSGATLTSLAIAESIAVRLGGTKPNLKFPQPVTIEEVRSVLPAAARLEASAAASDLQHVLDENGEKIGRILRTSPSADNVIGYQGPTDVLLVLDANGALLGMTIRRSYDNMPYVGYVTDEDYFMTLFNGRGLAQLAAIDSEQVEGVSGATMTSQSIAEGIARASAAASQPQQVVKQGPNKRNVIIAGRDIGTILIVVVGIAVCFTRVRSRRPVRFIWQVVLVVYLGFLNGDMVSQTLLVGWAESGVPWRLAPGLALLTAAAVVVPALTKRQLYCHHICPYGAAQFLVGRFSRWRVPLPRLLRSVLLTVPGGLLVVVVLSAMLHWSINLASLEPFDAFVVRLAGWATLSIAVVGLIAAAVSPMAYCRFGCPTGAVLQYVRRRGQGDRWGRRDWFAVGLVVLASMLLAV